MFKYRKVDQATAASLRRWFGDFDFDSVHLVERGPVCWYVRNVVKQGAMTISPFIFYGRERFDASDTASVALLAHELRHVEQYRELGHVRFLAKYLLELARRGFRYSRDLPLEAGPNALQAEVRLALQRGDAERIDA